MSNQIWVVEGNGFILEGIEYHPGDSFTLPDGYEYSGAVSQANNKRAFVHGWDAKLKIFKHTTFLPVRAVVSDGDEEAEG